MKKYIYLIVVFLLLGCAPSISKTKLQSDFTAYTKHVSNYEFDKVIEFMPEDFWNVYDKKEILASMNSKLNQFDSIYINNLEIDHISKSIKSNNKFFRVITYSSVLGFDTSNVSDEIIEKFKLKYGAEKVELDTTSNRIKIKYNSQMISVYQDKMKTWKYLEFDPIMSSKVYGIETSNKLMKYMR